jgi:hypothetical protein
VKFADSTGLGGSSGALFLNTIISFKIYKKGEFLDLLVSDKIAQPIFKKRKNKSLVIVYIKACCSRIVYQCTSWSPLLQPLRRCGQYKTPKAECSKQYGRHIFVITFLLIVLLYDSHYVFNNMTFNSGRINLRKRRPSTCLLLSDQRRMGMIQSTCSAEPCPLHSSLSF